MAAAIAIITRLALLAVLLAAPACNNEDLAPRTFIAGPRVLAIKAEPPEVPAGGSTTVHPVRPPGWVQWPTLNPKPSESAMP